MSKGQFPFVQGLNVKDEYGFHGAGDQRTIGECEVAVENLGKPCNIGMVKNLLFFGDCPRAIDNDGNNKNI